MISYLGHDDLSLRGFLDIVTMVLVSIVAFGCVFFHASIYIAKSMQQIGVEGFNSLPCILHHLQFFSIL